LLLGIGGWLQMNGEAVYGTRPWKIFGEGPTQVVGGSFTDTKRVPFTGQDIRFTTRGEILYAIALAWPEGGHLTVKSLASDATLFVQGIEKVELLGAAEPLSWTRDTAGLHVSLPARPPGDHAFAFRVTPVSPDGRPRRGAPWIAGSDSGNA
ncbi:MAG TPA: alpha-L-fucosidase C-terminal domain-containing protein, partial [Chloroflexota bacterium]|nr:alpha-L-fucosidase C-terminal domain-containing protein [Chloroflexota bacterium]